eukprot:TRINITY_DN2492_c0_g1_i3.p1 TRINITY_DN2492_c0_g1~~TRINITY_DN2492_c0_g1_i3.p1  ORF type:complete len:371 (-),score=65.31 TRINITY_DN2492_c0_g1_i3:74-1132(-)
MSTQQQSIVYPQLSATEPQNSNKKRKLNDMEECAIPQIKLFPVTLPSTFIAYNRVEGLGYFHIFSLKEIREFMDDYLSLPSICVLACCSRTWRYFCEDERLWKRFTRRKYKGNITFQNTWKMSLINWHNREVKRKKGETFVPIQRPPRDISLAPHFTGMDTELFKAYKHWYRTVINPEYYRRTCPEHVDRRSIKELTVQKFIDEYERPGKPVIITDAMNDWPAMKKWTYEQLLLDYGDVKFRTGGGFKMTLKNYFHYLRSQKEQVPLYLFDQNYAETTRMLKEYKVIDHFAEDLFKVVGEDERPPYRWILIGPARSGAPFHTDPRGTSAWNAVVKGTKRWAMYPPHVQPKGY